MNNEVRIHTRVLPGHRIEITTPQLLEGMFVDVMVVPSGAGAQPLTPIEILRLPLDERNKLLTQAAEEMVEYYEATADERIEWQGGDILE